MLEKKFNNFSNEHYYHVEHLPFEFNSSWACDVDELKK